MIPRKRNYYGYVRRVRITTSCLQNQNLNFQVDESAHLPLSRRGCFKSTTFFSSFFLNLFYNYFSNVVFLQLFHFLFLGSLN